MKRLIVLALALTACASPPTTYERGTLTRPPPAEARPGVGAPTYDPQVRPLPPQPNPKPTRVLPQDERTRREPGLWSASPQASFKDFKSIEPVILGVRLPYVYEPPSTEEETWPVRRCAAETSTIFDVYADRKALAELTGAERECLAALAYAFCAGGENFAAWLQQTALSPRALKLFQGMETRAVSFKDQKCNDATRTPRVNKLLMLLPMHWKTVKR